MLAPGLTFGAAGRTAATIGAGTVPNFFSSGIGFMTGGNLVIDTNAPAGNAFVEGILQSAAGAFYGKVGQLATDIFVQGIRVSALGQIVYESADATSFANGNGVTAAGNFSVN